MLVYEGLRAKQTRRLPQYHPSETTNHTGIPKLIWFWWRSVKSICNMFNYRIDLACSDSIISSWEQKKKILPLFNGIKHVIESLKTHLTHSQGFHLPKWSTLNDVSICARLTSKTLTGYGFGNNPLNQLYLLSKAKSFRIHSERREKTIFQHVYESIK